MPACPNCGRQALRTKDWACQWCGYPLISRSFKKIDKTFKELQEERKYAIRSEENDLEPEAELEPEPEPPPRPPLKPVYQPVPEPPPRPPVKPVYQPVPEPKPEPAPQPAPASGPPQVMITPPPVQPVPPELEPAPPSGRQPLTVPQSAPVILPETAAPPLPKPEIKIQPEPPPVPPVNLDSVNDGMVVTADQFDVLYRTDKSGAHAKFAGKTLVLKGRVEKVFVREHLEIRYVILAASQQKAVWSVRCEFERENAAGLNRLNEGEEVTVRGKYDGYSKNIIFKNCALV